MADSRVFLFLQGPPGPMFRQLSDAMQARGVTTHRINLNGGDRRNWGPGGIDYTARRSAWPEFFDEFVRANGVTDVILFGDRRPYHRIAHGIAKMRGANVHVMEEGYIRPHWMTLEPDGVNACSNLPRDIAWYRQQAAKLPPEIARPPITASFRRRVHDSYWYYHHVLFGGWRFPHFRNHRNAAIPAEAAGWVVKYLLKPRRARAAERTLQAIAGKRFFVFPLQLSGDYQIRDHSPFPDMQSASRFVIDSFAGHAPADIHLLIKVHPLDCHIRSWSHFIAHAAKAAGVGDRVYCIDGGDLDELTADAEGMVCVNSTSATLALQQDKPVCALGEAVYHMPGLTHQGHIDSFWSHPQAPEPGAYAAFSRVLRSQVLVRGGLASMSAVATLTQSILARFGISERR